MIALFGENEVAGGVAARAVGAAINITFSSFSNDLGVVSFERPESSEISFVSVPNCATLENSPLSATLTSDWLVVVGGEGAGGSTSIIVEFGAGGATLTLNSG